MTEQYSPITEEELNAYVDGQLDPARRIEVEQYLAQNPEVAQTIKNYQHYNQQLHSLFDATLDEPIPERLSIPQSKRRIPYVSLAQAATISIALTVGAVFGWVSRAELQPALTHDTSTTLAMVNDAFASHAVYTPEIRHPVEVTRDQEQHLVAWLSKRLGTNVRAPALTPLGYQLLGGRLLTSEGEPAALFMYENTQGQRLTLFTRHKMQRESQTAFRFASKGKIQGFYWIDGDLAYALIGEIDKSTISDAAHLVYQTLNR